MDYAAVNKLSACLALAQLSPHKLHCSRAHMARFQVDYRQTGDRGETRVGVLVRHLVGERSKSDVLPACLSGDCRGEEDVEGMPSNSDFNS